MFTQNHIFVIVYALIILAFGCTFISVFIYSTMEYYFPCPVAAEVFLLSKCIIEENYKRLYVLFCGKDYIVPIISESNITDVIHRVVSTNECWYKTGINCQSSSANENQIVYTRPAEYELYSRYKSCLALQKDYISVAHILWIPTSMAVAAAFISLLFIIPYLAQKEKESLERIEKMNQRRNERPSERSSKPLPTKPVDKSPSPPPIKRPVDKKVLSANVDKKVLSVPADKNPHPQQPIEKISKKEREKINADVRKAKKFINKINNRPDRNNDDDDLEMHSEPYGFYKNGSMTQYIDDVPECSTDSIDV